MKATPPFIPFALKTAYILIVTALFAFGAASAAVAQSVIYERRYNAADTVAPRWGRNAPNFLYGWAGGGFALGNGTQGLETQFGHSAYYQISLSYRRLLGKHLGVGAELGYRRNWFLLQKDTTRLFPEKGRFDEQSFVFPNLTVSVYSRLYLKKLRGTKVGWYLDAGVEMFAPVRPFYRTQVKDTANGEMVETTRRKLSYLSRVQPLVFVRAGYGRFALRFDYRITSLFKNEDQNLPPFSIGLAVGLY